MSTFRDWPFQKRAMRIHPGVRFSPEQENFVSRFLRRTEKDFQNLPARRRATHELSHPQVEGIRSIPGPGRIWSFTFNPTDYCSASVTSHIWQPFCGIGKHHRTTNSTLSYARYWPGLFQDIPIFQHFSGNHRITLQITYNITMIGPDNGLVIQESEIRTFCDSVKILSQSVCSQFLVVFVEFCAIRFSKVESSENCTQMQKRFIVYFHSTSIRKLCIMAWSVNLFSNILNSSNPIRYPQIKWSRLHAMTSRFPFWKYHRLSWNIM
jgi:hypothetical protein